MNDPDDIDIEPPESKKPYDEAIIMVVHTISPDLDDFLFTLFIILVTVYICNVLRELLLFSSVLDNLPEAHMWKLVMAEFIGTLESAVQCYEANFIIYDIFGVTFYTIMIFMVLVWQTKRAPEYQYDGNPLNVIIKYVESVHPMQFHYYEDVDSYYKRIEFIAIMIAAEIFSSVLAYQVIVNFVWKNADFWTFWKDENYHLVRYRTKSTWRTSIHGTAEFAGVVEGFFACLLYLWPYYLQYRGFRGQAYMIMIDAGRSVFAGFAAPYSGGYINPIFGYILEFNTRGISMLSRFMVYIFSPIVGTIIGMVLGGIKVN